MQFLSLHLSLPTCHLLNVQFVKSQTSNLRTALIVRIATENNTVNSNSQDTTALNPDVFVIVKLTLLRGRTRFVRKVGPDVKDRANAVEVKDVLVSQRQYLPNPTTVEHSRRLDSRVGLNKWAVWLIRRPYPRR